MIRLLTKTEAIAHFLSLPPEDRYCRFCSQASDDYIRKYVETAEGSFYGDVRVINPKDETGSYYYPVAVSVGVVHIYNDIKSNSAEVAVSVLPEYKGQSIGTKLMYFAHGVAEVYQAKTINVSGLGHNSPMIQLAKACGYTVKKEYGEFEGSITTIGADIKTITDNNIKIFKILLGVD